MSVISPYSRKVPLGDTSRFFCSVKHSAPKAVISWRKKGENGTISSGKHYTLIPNGALQIRNIRFEEGGDYECIAENLFTNKRHTSTDTGFIEVLPGKFYKIMQNVCNTFVQTLFNPWKITEFKGGQEPTGVETSLCQGLDAGHVITSRVHLRGMSKAIL